MIDDFRGGQSGSLSDNRRPRPPHRPVPSRRELHYSRRFSELVNAPQSTDGFITNNGGEAIATTMDGPLLSALDGILPPPVEDPQFSDSAGDGSGPDDTPSGNGDKDGEDDKKDKDSDDKQARWYARPFHAIAALGGKLSRTQWMIVASVFVLVAGSCSAAYVLSGPDEKQETPQAAAAPSKPKPVPPAKPKSPLTGMEVSAEDSKWLVTAVMIENSTNARPQSGLQEAGIVYEAIAEYGITRFMALYQEAKPANIGPIRSARPYFVDWAHSYDAPYAHVGGSPDALAKIKADGVKDLDQFHNSGAYRRISSRYAPHNVYTTMSQLNAVAAGKGWTGNDFKGFPRKKEAPVTADKRTAAKVDIAISGPTYNTHYDYDTDNNRYLRSMAGAPHKDADSGAQIAPKAVIAIVTDYGLEPDGYHSKYRLTGTGQAMIFQDGIVTPATWTRDTAKSQYVFTDAAGKPVALNPGQTWITVVGSANAVTHTP